MHKPCIVYAWFMFQFVSNLKAYMTVRYCAYGLDMSWFGSNPEALSDCA